MVVGLAALLLALLYIPFFACFCLFDMEDRIAEKVAAKLSGVVPGPSRMCMKGLCMHESLSGGCGVTRLFTCICASCALPLCG